MKASLILAIITFVRSKQSKQLILGILHMKTSLHRLGLFDFKSEVLIY